jgi:hypothetical protein
MNNGEYRHLDEVEGAIRAAQAIVPAVMEITGPLSSVVDVGGGTGGWLREFGSAGVGRLALVDAEAVRPFMVIPPECLHAADLEQPLPSLGRFDLAACLECAEHLSASRANDLVSWLASAADVVLFSAAIPGQGGKNHINEQFPRYWSALFEKQGFVKRDVLRQRFLTDPSIPWWYRQNLFFYVKAGRSLATSQEDLIPDDFALILREMEKSYSRPRLRKVLHDLPPAIAASLGSRFRRVRDRK